MGSETEYTIEANNEERRGEVSETQTQRHRDVESGRLVTSIKQTTLR